MSDIEDKNVTVRDIPRRQPTAENAILAPGVTLREGQEGMDIDEASKNITVRTPENSSNDGILSPFVTVRPGQSRPVDESNITTRRAGGKRKSSKKSHKSSRKTKKSRKYRKNSKK